MNRHIAYVIPIPFDIFSHEDLTPLDKIIAGALIYYSKDGYSTLGNSEIAKLCFCSTRSVSESVSRLVDRGFFFVANFDGRTRTLRYLNP